MFMLYLVLFRNSGDHPRLLDDDEIQRQLEDKQREIASYRAHREEVEKMRQNEKIQRNMLKKQQLETCERMQVGSNPVLQAKYCIMRK